MNTLIQDLRYGIRVMAKRPAMAAVAVLALAPGIGANTAVFSVINTVLLRELPYEDSDRLVRLVGVNALQDQAPQAKDAVQDFNLSPNDFFDLKERAQSFAGLAAFSSGTVTLTGRDEPLRLRCPVVSPEFFSVLGFEPVQGRFFLPEESRVGNHRVCVLSYGLWQRLFAGDADAVGQSLMLGGNAYTIIGVAPLKFEQPVTSSGGEPDLWRPLALELDAGSRGGHFLKAIGRLKPNVSIGQAQAEVESINADLTRAYPDTNTGRSMKLLSLGETIVGNVRPALMILLAAVALVLLIACANVANLLLARALARQKEIAIRMALGAGRKRLVRQLLTESLLLSATGGALGCLLAMWMTELLVSLGSNQIPRLIEARLDARVLAFTFGLSFVTGIIFGLVPALQISNPDLNTSLKEGGRSLSSAASGKRSRNLLVVAEVALSLVLLVGAGLLIKSFWRLTQSDLGFDADNLLTMDVSLPQARYPKRSEMAAFQKQLLERVKQLAGVESAGTVNMLPLSESYSCDGFTIDGKPVTPGEEPCIEVRSASADYFQAMGIRVIGGRRFSETDDASAPLVVIINESAARRFFPGEDPIGKRLNLDDAAEPRWREIVGMVEDVKHFGPGTEARPEVYQPMAQAPFSGMTVVARTDSDPSGLASAMRGEVWAMDKDLPVYNLRSMKDLVSKSVAEPRFRTSLLAIFAALALMLAGVGIYSVMSYLVTERTQEIGIRMALGASSRDVLRLVVGQGMVMAIGGVMAGLVAAFIVTRFISGLLYEVAPIDLPVFASISLLLLAISFVASYIPARRATRVDPMIALRYE